MTRWALLSLAAFLAVNSAGCSSDIGRMPMAAEFAGVSAAPLGFTSVGIGPGGGEISLDGVKVLIPQGALTETITVTLTTGSTAGLAWCEIDPSTAILQSPITAVLPLPLDCSTCAFGIRAVDPNTGLGVTMESEIRPNGVLAYPVQFGRFEVEGSD